MSLIKNLCELIFSGELHVPHRHLLERDQATGKVRKYQHTSKNLKIKLLLPRCTVHSNDEHCVKCDESQERGNSDGGGTQGGAGGGRGSLETHCGENSLMMVMMIILIIMMVTG